MKTEKELEIKLKLLDENSLSMDTADEFAGILQKVLGGRHNRLEFRFSSKPLQILETSYYDTSNLDLRKSKIAYRVRTDEGNREATIKTDIPQAGSKSSDLIAYRLEQTVKIPEDKAPEDIIDIFKDTQMSDLLKSVVGRKKLHLLFTTAFCRKTYLIEQEGRMKVLLCIDFGKITAEKATEKIAEIELELIEGNKEDIFNVASLVSKIIPVEIGLVSKYARGLVLSGKVPLRDVMKLKPSKNYEIAMDAASFENCVKSAMSNILDNLGYYNFAVKSHPSDYEAVHAFRVLLRHLISIASFSKSGLKVKEFKQIRSLAKDILKKSAKTREMDIFLHNWRTFLDGLEEDEKDDSASKITSIIIAHRQFERSEFINKLNDGKFALLQLEVSKYLSSDSVVSETQTDDNSDVLNRFITERDNMISELTKNFESLKSKKLHKIRLAVKEKRYILKYFDTGLTGEALTGETDRLKRLQNILGRLNDIVFILEDCTKILPESTLTDKFRQWLKSESKSMYLELNSKMEIINGN